jgi:hypothetical protein
MGVRAHLDLAGARTTHQYPPGALGVVTNLDGHHGRIDAGAALDVDRALALGPAGQLLEHFDEVGMEVQLGHGAHLRQGV